MATLEVLIARQKSEFFVIAVNCPCTNRNEKKLLAATACALPIPSIKITLNVVIATATGLLLLAGWPVKRLIDVRGAGSMRLLDV